MNPIKHINHIEDLVLGNNVASAVNAMRALIDGQATVTVKYDGSPSITFGSHENEFFLSTKSYFNLKAKYARSVDELYELFKAPVADKLKPCFDVLSRFDYDCVFQADLMYHQKTGDRAVTPNVVTYGVPEHLHRAYDVSHIGLAVHTKYTADSRCAVTTPVLNTTAVLEFQSDARRAGMDFSEALAALNEVDTSVVISDAGTTDALVRAVNASIRSNRDLDALELNGLSKYAMDNFNKMTRVKLMILDELDKYAVFTHFIGSKPSRPEGYVLHINDDVYKLVNRREFSAANFRRNG